MTEIVEKEEYKPLQRGYLITYIPFRVKLKWRPFCNCLKRVKPKTKLMIKPVSAVAKKRIANYCLYNVQPTGTEKDLLEKLKADNKFSYQETPLNDKEKKHFTLYKDIKNENTKIIRCAKKIEKDNINKEKKEISISDIEGIIKNHVGKDPNQNENRIVNKDNSNVFIENIEFSIFDDSRKNKLGFLKIRTRIDFIKDFESKDKVQAIRDIYDVISRNVKRKFDDKTRDLDFGFDYSDLSNTINNIRVDFVNKRHYKLKVNENDWLFNYEENDRRSYSFAYITIDENIEDYIKEETLKEYHQIIPVDEREEKEGYKQFLSSRDDLYHLSRLHENGAIRTYNKKNEIYKFYMDDTSAIWGISRVGIGALAIQQKPEELYRNIQVLNSDFSFLYEFALHQKFYYYLMIQHDNSLRKYAKKKQDLYKFIELFCPNVVSEFETQEIYEEVRDKLEIIKLLEDAKNSLDAFEAKKNKRKSGTLVFISFFLFAFLFPITIYDYIYKGLDVSLSISKSEAFIEEVFNKNCDILALAAIDRVSRIHVFLILMAIGLIVAILYYVLTGLTRNK